MKPISNVLIPALAAFIFWACNNSSASQPEVSAASTPDSTKAPAIVNTPLVAADATAILAKEQVPVLCYHRLRAWKPNEKESMKAYIVPIENFKAQIKMLADSGYHAITPAEYYDYLLYGKALPAKPVMLTFDDTSEEHYTVAATELEKYGFKGAFFIMTVSLGRPGYMSKEQVKELSDKGHTIASHTYDHHNVRKYEGEDWDAQMLKPKLKLEAITGKPVDYFAYPFGEWKPEAIPELQKRNYKAAFQLVGKRDSTAPLYTIRRMIVPGGWDGSKLHKWMKTNF
ncbi:MAG TPA: polysaccharide deacetylase family protein [Chitinophagaceae bacterium]|nr:polysaccharide deacetylase family protein [Chitinophagaceae bacterium]